MKHTFGEFLKEKRQEKGLTQKELAARLFVSPSAVSKWEKDVAHPDITLLPSLAAMLDVSEHELITASVDEAARTERVQARRWRVLAFSWQLFFFIAYSVALIPCFICNLAIDGTLSWFWIVFCALLLSFSFTNLPALISKDRLLWLPLAQYLSLVLLLGVICLYTGGNWFWLASISIFVPLAFVFLPIYLCKYKVFAPVRRFVDFVSLLIDFILVLGLLLLIDSYTITHGFSPAHWFLPIALPIASAIFVAVCILVSTRFLPINRLCKTALVLVLSALFLYVPPLLIKSESPTLQRELDDCNIFLADFSRWQVNVTLEQNIHLIIFLSLMLTALAFLLAGVRKHLKDRKTQI